MRHAKVLFVWWTKDDCRASDERAQRFVAAQSVNATFHRREIHTATKACCDQVPLIKEQNGNALAGKRFARKQRETRYLGAIIFYDMGVLWKGVLMSFRDQRKSSSAEFLGGNVTDDGRSGADDRNGRCSCNKSYQNKKMKKINNKRRR